MIVVVVSRQFRPLVRRARATQSLAARHKFCSSVSEGKLDVLQPLTGESAWRATEDVKHYCQDLAAMERAKVTETLLCRAGRSGKPLCICLRSTVGDSKARVGLPGTVWVAIERELCRLCFKHQSFAVMVDISQAVWIARCTHCTLFSLSAVDDRRPSVIARPRSSMIDRKHARSMTSACSSVRPASSCCRDQS